MERSLWATMAQPRFSCAIPRLFFYRLLSILEASEEVFGVIDTTR
jgi:hypothetical protein